MLKLQNETNTIENILEYNNIDADVKEHTSYKEGIDRTVAIDIPENSLREFIDLIKKGSMVIKEGG